MRKKAKITIERERVLVVSRSKPLIEAQCPVCAAMVQMVSVEEAGLLAEISQREIFRLAESGEIHFIENAQGQAMFCLDSLSQLTRVEYPELNAPMNES